MLSGSNEYQFALVLPTFSVVVLKKGFLNSVAQGLYD